MKSFPPSYSLAIFKAMNILIQITFIMHGNISLYFNFLRALLVISFHLEIAKNESQICI